MLQILYRYKLTLLTSLVILTLSLISSSEMPSTKLWDFKGIDKLVHMGMYSTLSFILFLEKYRNLGISSKQPFNQNNIYPIMILIIMGGTIELIQPIIANRSREMMDFVANTIGVFIGFYLQFWFKQLLKCQKIR